ncbi:MAG: hypothetical protein OEM01_13685, partial [Desulfobulbaceae bacterium]|nr:hypothetical protein [Desulfobulbaceae bacterium]
MDKGFTNHDQAVAADCQNIKPDPESRKLPEPESSSFIEVDKQLLSLAKITRPAVDGMLFRERLFQRLDEPGMSSVIWISGPAGSGKTTLVSSYLEAGGLPYLWYQVDGGDTDLATFFYYLGLAVQKASSRRSKPMPLLTPEYLLGIPEFSRNFFAELF